VQGNGVYTTARLHRKMGKKAGAIICKDGKVRQVIVRHIGMAKDEEKFKHFIRLAEFIKAEVDNERQMSLFLPFLPELAY